MFKLSNKIIYSMEKKALLYENQLRRKKHVKIPITIDGKPVSNEYFLDIIKKCNEKVYEGLYLAFANDTIIDRDENERKLVDRIFHLKNVVIMRYGEY